MTGTHQHGHGERRIIDSEHITGVLSESTAWVSTPSDEFAWAEFHKATEEKCHRETADVQDGECDIAKQQDKIFLIENSSVTRRQQECVEQLSSFAVLAEWIKQFVKKFIQIVAARKQKLQLFVFWRWIVVAIVVACLSLCDDNNDDSASLS